MSIDPRIREVVEGFEPQDIVNSMVILRGVVSPGSMDDLGHLTENQRGLFTTMAKVLFAWVYLHE